MLNIHNQPIPLPEDTLARERVSLARHELAADTPAHLYPCQGGSHWPAAQKTGRGSLLIVPTASPPPLPTTHLVKGLNSTELNYLPSPVKWTEHNHPAGIQLPCVSELAFNCFS